MRSHHLANAAVRTVLAMLFGFMSLFHGTVMASAKANRAATHHAMAGAHHGMKADNGHHHHQATHAQQSDPAMPDVVPSCYGIGCFIVLDAPAPGSPAANVRAIGILSPSIVEAMMPADIDPVVPPPRL